MLAKIKALFLITLLGTLPAGVWAYTVSPGDQLQVEVLEDSSLNRVILVLPDGSVSFPGIGSLKIAGQDLATVKDRLSQRLVGQFANKPTVYVSVAQVGEKAPTVGVAIDPHKIYIMGEVNSPGVMESDDPVTLLQAIAQAGGFTRFAATKRIELHRLDRATQTVEVYIYNHKRRTGIPSGTTLAEGDVVVVPERRLFE